MLTYEIWVYLCGAFMGLVFAVTACRCSTQGLEWLFSLKVVVAQEESNDLIP